MRIAICEDEAAGSESLVKCIENWMRVRKATADIQCFESAESFLCAWPEINFDLIFLDIQMRHISGLQLAEEIRKTGSDVMLVFATNFQQYVIKGYDVDALHYLIKPTTNAKLMPVLDKAYKIWRSKKLDTLYISNGTVQRHIRLASIDYITMSSHTAEIYTEDGVYALRKTAAELTGELPDQFIRCHRSYIVNLHKVECVYKESLTLKNNTRLPVSRNCWKQVNIAFIRFHTG